MEVGRFNVEVTTIDFNSLVLKNPNVARVEIHFEEAMVVFEPLRVADIV